MNFIENSCLHKLALLLAGNLQGGGLAPLTLTSPPAFPFLYPAWAAYMSESFTAIA